MKFRPLSDIHLEFEEQDVLFELGGMDVPALEDDNKTVLVLAGDIALADKSYTYEKFIERVSDQFRDVIWIPGNHEYYHTSLKRAIPKIEERLKMMGVMNVHFGDRFTVVIDDTAFICTTMWTDMDERDPTSAYFLSGPNGMNDFKKIRTGPRGDEYQRRARVIDFRSEFIESKRFIFEELTKHMEAGLKTVVVTHHCPSSLSIAPEWKGSRFNGAYVAELSNDIIDTGGPNAWIHGHVHNSFDYVLGDTRVVCNPRGYVGDALNPDFDPEKVIEL